MAGFRVIPFASWLLVVAVSYSMHAQPPPPATAESSALTWERWPDLPDPAGWKGMFAGTSNGRIILAGGSNFPIPQREGGAKNLGRQIHVRPTNGGPNVGWQLAGTQLPEGRAEGGSASSPNGILCVGGLGPAGPMAGVQLLAWDKESTSIRIQDLPDLPEPCANAAAVYAQGYLYVAGGDRNGQGLANFRRLDVKAAQSRPAGTAWETLPGWPGPRRFGAVLAVLRVNGREQLFLFGGRIEAAGKARLSDYLADGYRYNPATKRWTRLGLMPDRALLPGSLRIDESRLAILGGSNGHSLEQMAELGERYRIPDRIMIYDANTDHWSGGGRMPVGVVAPAVVELGSGWLVAGGEYSPGLRTARVFRVIPDGGASREQKGER